MDQDYIELRNEINRLSEQVDDTNRIVNKLYQSQVRSNFYKAGYLILILILGISFYFMLKPVYQTISNVYSSGLSGDESGLDSDDFGQLLNLFEQARTR